MTNSKKTEAKNEYAVKVTRAYQFDNGNVSFDCVVNGISVYGMTVIEGKKGDFIAFPQRKGSDDKYYKYVWFEISEELQADIIKQIEKLL